MFAYQLFLAYVAMSCNTFDTITTPSTIRKVTQTINKFSDFGIGIWTKFFPQIAEFEIPLQDVEQMLVFAQSNRILSEFYIVYSIKYDNISVSGILYHEVYLYIGGSFQKLSLPVDARSSIQRWVFLYLCRNTMGNYSIFIYYSSEREQTQMAKGINGVWPQLDFFLCQIGQTIEFQNQFNPQVIHKFSIFRGYISDLYFQNNVGSYYSEITDFLNFIETLDCTIPNSCPSPKQIDLLTPVTIFYGHSFISKSAQTALNRYILTGWAKVRVLENGIGYSSVFIRVTTNQNYQDNRKQGDRVFYMKYIQHIQPEKNGFYISTYSTNFDNTKDDYSSTPSDEWVDYDEFYEIALTKWHFISFQYGLSDSASNTKVEIFFSHQQITKTKLLPNRDQLPDQKYYFNIGGDKYSQANLFQGEIASLQFSYCFPADLTPIRPCHYSCAQCLGPTKSDCNLCADSSLTNRQYIPSTGECPCQIGYFEREGEVVCHSLSGYFNFVQLEEVEFFPNCNYGEFSIGGEYCMACPVLIQDEGFYCADCWMNPRSWYLSPKCTFDYLKDYSSNSFPTYRKRQREKQDEIHYLLDKINRRLEVCEGCFYLDGQAICKPCYKSNSEGFCIKYLENCKECNNLALTCTICDTGYVLSQSGCVPCPVHCVRCSFNMQKEKAVCLSCEQHYGLDEGECRQCGQYCAICERQVLNSISFMKCFRCDDTKIYFLSFDGENCHPNTLPQCLIAAQVKQNNLFYFDTSLDFKYIPSKISNPKTVCLRCKPGLVYHTTTNRCLPSTEFDETIVDSYAITQNLGKNTNPQLSQSCPQNCNKCIEKYIFFITFCINCDYGYYSYKYSGECNSCPVYLNCRACSHQNTKYKDDWKWDIRGAYYHSISRGGFPMYTFTVESDEPSENEVMCTSCRQGYIFLEGHCIRECHHSCKTCIIVNYQSQCVECKSTLQGQLQSVENGECIACPQNCAACRSYSLEELQQINSYFDLSNSNDNAFSRQCLIAFNLPFLYYDWDLTQFIQCQALKKPCKRMAKVVFQTHCSDEIYDNARLAAANREEFNKFNIKLSTVFNNKEAQSFPQIENKEFYYVMNQKQVNKIQITLTLVYDEQGQCRFAPFSRVTSQLRAKIFTLQVVELVINGKRNLELYPNTEIRFLNLERIRLQNIYLVHDQDTQISFTGLQAQFIQLENILIKSYSTQPKRLQFNFTNVNFLEISNMELNNLLVEQTNGIFHYELDLSQQGEFRLKINNLKIIDSLFLNSHLFSCFAKAKSILQHLVFNVINIQNSKFTSSAFLKSSSKLQKIQPKFSLLIASFLIQDSQINNSTFIDSQGINCQVESLTISRVEMINSVILEVEVFTFKQFKLTNNRIVESCIINAVSQDLINEENQMLHFSIENNNYTNSKSLINYQQINQKKLIIVKLFLKCNSLLFNQFSSQQQIFSSNSLINLVAQEVQINQTIIMRGQGYPEIAISSCKRVSIDYFHITLGQQFEIETIHPLLDCLQSKLIEQFYTSFMFLYAVQIIKIHQMEVIGLIAINKPLVHIKSIDRVTLVQEDSISITDSLFANNNLIITQLAAEQSILAIYSEQVQRIEIQACLFHKNQQYSYIKDITQKSATTLLISSPNSKVFVASLKMANCLISNNKGSNMIIRAKELKLKDSKFENLNQVSYADLKSRIFWGSGVENFYEESLQQFLTVLSEGGAGYINVQSLEISNSIVSLSDAFHGGGFYIEVKDQGAVNITNCIFICTVASLLEGAVSKGGALFINSQAAILDLTISNCQFNSTFSRMEGGGIYIMPSLIKNMVKITSAHIINSYSFSGSFLLMAQTQVMNGNDLQLLMSKIHIENLSFSNFLQRLVRVTSQEEESFPRSFLIDVYGGQINLTDTYLEALEYNGLIKFTEFQELTITKIVAKQIKPFQPQISLSPTKCKFASYSLDYQGRMVIKDVSFQNFSEPSQLDVVLSPILYLEPQTFYCKKSFEKPKQLQMFFTELQKQSTLQRNLQQLVQSYKNISALISIQGLTSTWFVEFTNLLFQNIQCQRCQNGLLSIKGIDLKKGRNLILVSDSKFSRNNCGQEGCLHVKSEPTLQTRLLSSLNMVYMVEQTLQLNNVYFTSNYANFGGGLYLSAIDVLIVSCLFNNNTAGEAGGAVYFVRSQENESMSIYETELTNNNASQGGAFYIQNYTLNSPNLMNIFLYGNQAGDFGSNLVQPPLRLTVSINQGINFLNTKEISHTPQSRLDQIELSNGKKQELLFPSGQPLGQYKYFDYKSKHFINANLSLRVIALNNQGQRMKNLYGTKCFLDGRIIDLVRSTQNYAGSFSKNYTSLHVVPFNLQTQDYNFDDLIISFDPQFRDVNALQLRFRCDSIKIPIFDTNPPFLLQEYQTNYSLLMHVQTFFCQQGESLRVENNSISIFKLVSICQLCDSSQDLFSVQPGEPCRLKDQKSMLNVTAARVELRKVLLCRWQGYWRPSENSVLVESCKNLEENCHGGWESGDQSCFTGHIGALCEQCDLYNSRGDGTYSVSTTYKCGSCNEIGDNLTKLIFVSFWTIISIILSVQSTLDANLLVALGNKFKKIGIQVNPLSGIGGILIKVFTNYVQIISTLATFQLKLPSAITTSITSVGSPLEAMSFSLDCFIIEVAKDTGIEIIYFRIIWGFIMPILYIFAYFLFQIILIFLKTVKPNSGVISTTLVYMYIYLQPAMIGGLASLISFRKIAGIVWIQGNVSYQYSTQQHYYWLQIFIVPFIFLFAIIIPIMMLIQLFINREQLDNFRLRQKWGYIYNEYKNKSYFWEIVKIYQKSLIIIFITFYEDIIVIKAAMIFIIVFVYQLLSRATRPYSIPQLNKLDDESSIICQLSIVLGITIYTANLTDNQEILWPFYLILVGGNAFFITHLLLELMKAQMHEKQEIIDKFRDKVGERFPSLKNGPVYIQRFLQNRGQQRKRVESRFKLIKAFLIKQGQVRLKIIKNCEQSIISQTEITSGLKQMNDASNQSKLKAQKIQIKKDDGELQKIQTFRIPKTLDKSIVQQIQKQTGSQAKQNFFKSQRLDHHSKISPLSQQLAVIDENKFVENSDSQSRSYNIDKEMIVDSYIESRETQPQPLLFEKSYTDLKSQTDNTIMFDSRIDQGSKNNEYEI